MVFKENSKMIPPKILYYNNKPCVVLGEVTKFNQDFPNKYKHIYVPLPLEDTHYEVLYNNEKIVINKDSFRLLRFDTMHLEFVYVTGDPMGFCSLQGCTLIHRTGYSCSQYRYKPFKSKEEIRIDKFESWFQKKISFIKNIFSFFFKKRSQ